jgi:hypothetical protein
MTKARALFVTTILIIVPLIPIHRVFADGIISSDFRYSNWGAFSMTTNIVKFTDDVDYEDYYAVQICLNSHALQGLLFFNSISFSVTGLGEVRDARPHTGFEGGGISVGIGSGGLNSISGSVPISTCYTNGIGTTGVTIDVKSLYPAWYCDACVLFATNEGESFDWAISASCSLWTIWVQPPIPTFVQIWSDTAAWAPSSMVRPPTAVLMTKGSITTTTARFNASQSTGGYDGDQLTTIQSYSWDFGDGSRETTTTPVVNHTYPHAGTFKTELTTYAPGIGWTSPKYIDHSTSKATIEILSDTVAIDIFMIIENYDETMTKLESRYVSGIGQNSSYGGHVKQQYNHVWVMAYVTENGTAVSGTSVGFFLRFPDNSLNYVGWRATNASGIALMECSPFYSIPPTECIYGFVAMCGTKRDEVRFSYGICFFMTGFTYDGFTFYIENIYLVPESSVASVIAYPPAGWKLKKWIIDFFYEAPAYNPLYIEIGYDRLVIAQFKSVYDVNDDGVIDLKDVFLVGRAYGSRPGDPRWNPVCDFNHDGIIDLKDYFPVCKHYGENA